MEGRKSKREREINKTIHVPPPMCLSTTKYPVHSWHIIIHMDRAIHKRLCCCIERKEAYASIDIFTSPSRFKTVMIVVGVVCVYSFLTCPPT